MTNDEWKKVEEQLQTRGSVKLSIDGYTVALFLMHETTTKMVIGIYVNGTIKGKWSLEDCEERRRFFQDKKKYIVKADTKTKKRLKMTDSEFQAFREKYTVHSYLPYWSSFRTLKNHLIKNNKSIELFEETKE